MKNKRPISECRASKTIANHLPYVFTLYGVLYEPLGITGQPTGHLVQEASQDTLHGVSVYQYLLRHFLGIAKCPGSRKPKYYRIPKSLVCDIEKRCLKASQSVVKSAFSVGKKSPASSKYFWTLVEAAPGWARPPKPPKPWTHDFNSGAH